MSVGSKLSVNGRLFVLPVGTERKVVSVCIASYPGPAPPGRGLHGYEASVSSAYGSKSLCTLDGS